MTRIVVCANTAENIVTFRGPLIDALKARGDEVIVIAQINGGERRLKEGGYRIIDVAIDSKGINPFRDLGLMFSLGRVYASLKPDVILNFTIKPVIFGTLSAKQVNIPVINTITGLGTAFINETW